MVWGSYEHGQSSVTWCAWVCLLLGVFLLYCHEGFNVEIGILLGWSAVCFALRLVKKPKPKPLTPMYMDDDPPAPPPRLRGRGKRRRSRERQVDCPDQGA